MAFGRSIIFDGSIYPAKFGDNELELRFSAAGKAVLNFVVSTYGGKDRDGEKKDNVSHRCVAFGDLAENIAESCKKGDEVIIVGSLESNNWIPEDGDEDDKRYGTQVLVDMCGISLRWDTASSDKMWADKGDEKPKKKGKKKGKKGGGKIKRTDYGPDEAPF